MRSRCELKRSSCSRASVTLSLPLTGRLAGTGTGSALALRRATLQVREGVVERAARDSADDGADGKGEEPADGRESPPAEERSDARAEVARRVHPCARHGAENCDERCDRRADHHWRTTGRSRFLRVSQCEYYVAECACRDRLDSDDAGRAPQRARIVRDAECAAQRRRARRRTSDNALLRLPRLHRAAEDEHVRNACDGGPRNLRENVVRRCLWRNHIGSIHGERNRDGRIQVRAAHVASRVHRSRDRAAPHCGYPSEPEPGREEFRRRD